MGIDVEIFEFVILCYDVMFFFFLKIEVNGDNVVDFYKWFKVGYFDEDGNEDIGWNFMKFLVNLDS